MAAFTELNWSDLDVSAIVYGCGIATIEEEHREECRQWLARNDYSVDSLDCTQPPDDVSVNLRLMLRWEEQFGYAPTPSRNLDALRDGFYFLDLPHGSEKNVLELRRVDLLWHLEPEWVRGILNIAQECCRYQLALGRRFFVLLVVEAQSPMIGAALEEEKVPGPFWLPGCSPYQRRQHRLKEIPCSTKTGKGAIKLGSTRSGMRWCRCPVRRTRSKANFSARSATWAANTREMETRTGIGDSAC